jgi:hypothetical protein
MNNSGFGTNSVTLGPSAPVDVWERCIDAHPGAGALQFKPRMFYEELDFIFMGKIATGKYAMSSEAFHSYSVGEAALQIFLLVTSSAGFVFGTLMICFTSLFYSRPLLASRATTSSLPCSSSDRSSSSISHPHLKRILSLFSWV